MADEPAGRTSLGVLHEILTNLGDSNTYITVVDALEALLNVLGSGGIGQAVSDWLAAHPEATTTVQNGSITLLKLANDVKSAIDGKAASSDLQALADNLATLAQTVAEKADASDLDDKADIDGYYSQLTAGLAENLIGRGDAVPAEYLYRTAGGTADIEDGIATIDCIKGNTVTWNQLVPDTRVHKSGTATSSAWLYTPNFAMTSGHKYLLVRSGTYPDSGNTCRVVSTTAPNVIYGTAPNVSNKQGVIFECTDTRDTYYVQAWVVSGEDYDFYLNVYDLTLMFGAGNEPATVAEFEAMFPLPYYPYSAPKLLPVDMRGIETVGFNLLEDASRFNKTKNQYANSLFGSDVNALNAFKDNLRKLKLLGQNLYWHIAADNLSTSSGISVGTLIIYGETPSITLKTIQRDTVFSLSNLDIDRIGYVVLYGPSPSTTVTFSEACISIVWSGYRNGEYEEYWNFQREIPVETYFPDGMRSAGSVADELTPSKAITRVGVVDLGTLNWVMVTSSEAPYFSATMSGIVHVNRQDNFICTRYDKSPIGSTGTASGICTTDAPSVRIRDTTYSTAADFKTAMSGVMLYYELAEPTEVTIDPPLNLSYKVSDFGTERIMVDETADAPQTAPVPMEVEYGINAIDTIRRLLKEYQSHKSMGQLTAALESSLGIDITETWDEDDQRYEYEVSNLEVGTDEIENGSITDAKLAQTGGVLEAVNTHLMNRYETVNPLNWCDHAALSSGKLLSSGVIEVSSTSIYTDFIPVTASDVVRAYYRTNGMYMTNVCAYDANKTVLPNEGRDTSGMTFTVGASTKYVRVSFNADYDAKAMVTVNAVPTAYEDYFAPCDEISDDFLTPQSQAAVNAILSKSLSSMYLANRYGCALPRTTCRQTIGLAQSWYRASMATPSTTFIHATAGMDYCTFSNDAVTFPNTTPIDSTTGYKFEFHDPMYADIEMGGLDYSLWGWPRHFVAENLSDCSMLVIGDSTVDQGDCITSNLLSHFSAQNHTLTLLGTLGSGDNKNEGRAGWRATDYLTDKSYEGTVNPFYNPATQTFDFAYYMTNQGYTAPDFVVVQLGINDLYLGNDASIVSAWNAVKTIVDSIVSYADGVKVILNLPTAPNSNQSVHSANAVFLPSLINRIVRYNELATKRTLELYSDTRVRTSYCHLILDPANDIYDTVHPKQAGYEKMALEIVNQVNCWLN